jgi:type II secretory pathway predicted ATPase ExeA
MLAFFGMKQAPFTREIAPDQLFHSSSHKEAMARLEYAVQERQTCMLTGEAGMGKTTMVRAFAKQLDPARTHYEYMCDSALTPKLFYREVLGRFGMNGASRPTELKRQYQTCLLDMYEQDKKTTIIVIDEAHRLSETMMQEIRFLLNFKEDSMSPLALILIGQPSLRNQLKARHLDAIDQRIQTRYQFQGFSEGETRTYIQHQVKVSGSMQEIFSEEALVAIHQFSHGVPRRINTLCSQSLLDAFVRENKIVGEAHVHRAMNEM